ncbi:MAG: hypothetical protein LQ348_005929 [Seirophora lacunosa]|nr:MAG: hypothetical protein LQ348_005929 [Seirophora lacunosa]
MDQLKQTANLPLRLGGSSNAPVPTTSNSNTQESSSRGSESAVVQSIDREHNTQHIKRTPQQPNTREQAWRLKQRILSIINATYGICKGRDLNPEARSLAYPVIRINYRTYLVPATFSDYLTLRSYKLDSDAYRASFKFDVSAAIPGHSRRTSCITVTMPNQGHEVAKGFGAIILAKLLQAGFKNDDGRPIRVSHIARTKRVFVLKDPRRSRVEPHDSITMTGAEYPFLVMEVRDIESVASLENKVRAWLQWSKAMTKIICTFEIENDPVNRYRILASVLRAVKTAEPTVEKPGRVVIREHWVFRRVDISSRPSPASFTISAAEVRSLSGPPPEDATARDCVTVDLAAFYPHALVAIEEKVEEEAQRDAESRGENPYVVDSDQAQAFNFCEHELCKTGFEERKR